MWKPKPLPEEPSAFFQSILHVIIGLLNEHWNLFDVDVPEWTQPKYGHQN